MRFLKDKLIVDYFLNEKGWFKKNCLGPEHDTQIMTMELLDDYMEAFKNSNTDDCK